jgi:hypothetical protein
MVLLKRDDITKRIAELNQPCINHAQNTIISEREKKRAVLWDLVENGDDNIKCRALDILNRMDSEYLNININRDDTTTPLDNLDTETLQKLADTN